ncbi:MAG: hypothetical protein IJ151_04800 [Bacteroidales bacterium]|nr:hypothetical protein [Bacteroidales bacterium]
MKTRISFALAAIAALCLSWSASARVFNGKGDFDKFKSEKIAYITSELNMTPAEAEKFWPVYNQMVTEKQNALKEVMKVYKQLDEAVKNNAAEAEINKLTKAYLEANNAFLSVDGKYLDDFTKVLPAEKVAKLYLSEERFRRQQIHRLGKGKPGDGKVGEGKPGKGPQGRPQKGERPQQQAE